VLLTLGWSETRMNVGESAGDGEEEVAGVDEEDGGRARADLGVYSSMKQRLRKREPRRFRSTAQVGSSWSMATVARYRRRRWLSVGFLSRKKRGWRRRVRGRRRARVAGLAPSWFYRREPEQLVRPITGQRHAEPRMRCRTGRRQKRRWWIRW
jgi:hypothetical protein